MVELYLHSFILSMAWCLIHYAQGQIYLYLYNYYIHRVGWYDDDALDLYSEGAWFQTRICYPGQDFYTAFLCPSKQMPGY
jgi:hypothetical protein